MIRHFIKLWIKVMNKSNININCREFLFEHRWNPLALASLLTLSALIGFVLIHFMKSSEFPPKDLPWTVILTVVASPWLLFIWFLRDYNKEQDIQNSSLQIWQQDFHVQQQRASNWSEPSLQLSAIYVLRGYFLGTALPDHIKSRDFIKESIIKLFSALLSEAEKHKDSPVIDQIREGTQQMLLMGIELESAKSMDWSNVNLKGKFLSGKNLSQFKMPFANFVDANLNGTKFKETALWGSKFDGAVVIQAEFPKADVSWSSFIGADLDGADFSNALIQEANFKDAKNIEKAKFANAQYSKGTTFSDDFIPQGAILVEKTPESNGAWVRVKK